MTEIAEIIINDQYLLLAGISIFFTVFAITRNSVTINLLTTICWWICGAVHLLASPSTTPLYSISLFYWGIGLIFFVRMWAELLQIFRVTKENKGVGAI